MRVCIMIENFSGEKIGMVTKVFNRVALGV